MKTALVVMLLSVMTITACSSNNTPKTQYYVLNSPTKDISIDTITSTPEIEKKSTIFITLLELPDYLAQANIVLQLSDHRLHYSNFHMWAEPLRIGLAQALANDLSKIDTQYDFSTDMELYTAAQADIRVKITAFQPTHQSQVVLAGSYTFQQTAAVLRPSTIKKANDFKFTINLNDNGYAHAVEKMREVISPLAQKISADINASTSKE